MCQVLGFDAVDGTQGHDELLQFPVVPEFAGSESFAERGEFVGISSVARPGPVIPRAP
jgi:hypothetical protein